MASQELLSTLLQSSPNLRDFVVVVVVVSVPITQALKADRFLISSLKHDVMNKTALFTAMAKGENYRKRPSCIMGHYLAGLIFCVSRNRDLHIV